MERHDNSQEAPRDGDTATKKQAKQTQKPRERKRRNYAAELADLERRTDAAMKLLKRCHDKELPVVAELIGAALETLAGE